MGDILQKLKRYRDAIVRISETVKIGGDLVESEGGSYKFDLAHSLYVLSNLHLELGENDEAAGFVTEAMEVLATSSVDDLQGLRFDVGRF